MTTRRDGSIWMLVFMLMAGGVISEVGGADVGVKPVRVLVWDEQQPEQKQAYQGRFLGETIARHLERQAGLAVRSVAMDAPEQGLDEVGLDGADVLVMWSHRRSAEIGAVQAERVVARVQSGKLGLIALHSAHWARPYVRLMQERAKWDALKRVPEEQRATAKWEYLNENPYYKGVTREARLTPYVKEEGGVWRLVLPQCVFPGWRADGAPSHVTTVMAGHPVAKGLPAKWVIPQTEMYDEPFHVPEPDAVIFEEKWDKGERFRSGCVWKVGEGQVFYFRPGHETYPVYTHSEPLRVIENAVRWMGRGR